jgi:uncharacterized protein (DUF488 family)
LGSSIDPALARYNSTMERGTTPLYTIGHSNHSLDTLIRLLAENGVASVVDVRSAPYSRYSPQFNKSDLERTLQPRGLSYAYAGKYLGGRPMDPTCYRSGMLPVEGADYLHEVDYAEVMKRDWFLKGVNRLLDIAARRPTAVMCSEENPENCHRHHLIARYLMANVPEVKVRHVRGDGMVYGAETIVKSVAAPTVIQSSLF